MSLSDRDVRVIERTGRLYVPDEDSRPCSKPFKKKQHDVFGSSSFTKVQREFLRSLGIRFEEDEK